MLITPRSPVLLAWLLVTAVPSPLLASDELNLDAQSLIARSVIHRLWLRPDEEAIELKRGVLYEDDGPAAGYSYRPNEEKLTPEVHIKKELLVPAPQARQATLLVGRGGEVNARINGRPAALERIGKQGNYWQAYRFSPDLLRPGKNELVLWGNGQLWIARDDEYAAGSLTRRRHPDRSAKSRDGGKTWNYEKLGTDDNLDGEYYVRLFLDQHFAEGRLTTHVLDVANLAQNPVAPPVDQIGPIRIEADVACDPGDETRLLARTGTSFVPDQKRWSDWTDITADRVIATPRGRYFQVEIRVSSPDRMRSPQLTGLKIAGSPARAEDWTSDIRVTRFDNQQIVRSSVPFRYEPFDHPQLAKLRRKYKLDEVVAGADTELELIERLAAWSATRWQRMHLKESYPPYNALAILKSHPDGTPVGGFCQQYNIVFLQACESFGLAGRLVSLGPGNLVERIRGGHETAEIWSNQFGKWIYIDGNTAWYAVDSKSRVPLSLWELRQRQLAAFENRQHRPIDVRVLAETRYAWKDLQHWPPFVELRLISRSDFLSRPAPLPLNQGMRGWFWTGHYVWSDDRLPARMLYGRRIENKGHFQWTLNQAQLALEATDQPGMLDVHIDTETPGLAEFVITANGQETTQTENRFQWNLKRGTNTLSVAPRNNAGRLGIASAIELSYAPGGSD